MPAMHLIFITVPNTVNSLSQAINVQQLQHTLNPYLLFTLLHCWFLWVWLVYTIHYVKPLWRYPGLYRCHFAQNITSLAFWKTLYTMRWVIVSTIAPSHVYTPWAFYMWLKSTLSILSHYNSLIRSLCSYVYRIYPIGQSLHFTIH